MDYARLRKLRSDSVAVQVKVAALEFEKLAGRMLGEYGLTISQYKALKLVIDVPATAVRQVDIERAFGMTNPTVTGIVRNLEKKGLIERVENPQDARSKVIVPTQKALDLKEALHEAGREAEREFTKPLAAAERTQLLALLDKLLVN